MGRCGRRFSRIIEIYGPESSGKTTLALHILAQAQKMGGEVAFVDAEHALDPDYAAALGVDTDEKIKEMFGNDPRILATLEKDTCKTRDESLLEIYRRLRPGEPPTVESAEAYLDALFFDARRYDVSKVGRYKFNKKMDIWSRLSGQEVVEPIADPMTGEILVMPGEIITRAMAHTLSDKGVSTAVVKVGDSRVTVLSNGMVDMANMLCPDKKEGQE